MNRNIEQLITKFYRKHLSVYKKPFEGYIREILGNVLINYEDNTMKSLSVKEFETYLNTLGTEKTTS